MSGRVRARRDLPSFLGESNECIRRLFLLDDGRLRQVGPTLLQGRYRGALLFFGDSPHHFLAHSRPYVRDSLPPRRALGSELQVVSATVFLTGGPVQPSLPDETIYDYGHASRFYAKVLLKRLLGDPPRSVDLIEDGPGAPSQTEWFEEPVNLDGHVMVYHFHPVAKIPGLRTGFHARPVGFSPLYLITLLEFTLYKAFYSRANYFPV